MTNTTTRLTGLTWHQVQELQEIARLADITPAITSATTCTIRLSVGELLDWAELAKRQQLTAGVPTVAISSVIRKLKRHLEPTPDKVNWDRLLSTGEDR